MVAFVAHAYLRSRERAHEIERYASGERGEHAAADAPCAVFRRLDGKVCVITGAAHGIGRAIAVRCALEGASVVVLVDLPSEAEGFSSAVNAASKAVFDAFLAGVGGQVAFLSCDVTDGEQVAATMKEVRRRFGTLHVLFANAGVPSSGKPLYMETGRDFDRVLSVNVGGVFRCAKHAIPLLLGNGGAGCRARGSIITTGSVFGTLASHNAAAYVASKAAVAALTRALALELGPSGIRVAGVEPGFIDNDMGRRRKSMAEGRARETLGKRRQTAALAPAGREGSVAEVAAAAVWLASEEAAFVTGTMLRVDGGLSCTFNSGARTHRAFEEGSLLVAA